MLRRGNDDLRLRRLQNIARNAGVPLLAINDVLYHTPERRGIAGRSNLHPRAQDARQCRHAFGGQRPSPFESAARNGASVQECPEAITETLRFAEQVTFTLADLKYNYPDEPCRLEKHRRNI